MKYLYTIYYLATFKDSPILHRGFATLEEQSDELDKDYLIEESRKQFLRYCDIIGKGENDVASFKCEYYTIEFLPEYVSSD